MYRCLKCNACTCYECVRGVSEGVFSQKKANFLHFF